ncbi:hypothetical protein TrispH2_000022 [Trichoplax sp. H2]|nr:hypothetical protein TrispH2_000022 [Trichoplax sp. H2]|eukprot:RDD47081.1 hypothetical protein TrispH2_000022 [Trichoplax sp. H2]
MENKVTPSVLFLLLACYVDGAWAYLNVGGIIGIAIGCFIVIIVIPVLICVCCAGAIGCAAASTGPPTTVAVIPATHTTTTVNYPPMYNPGMQTAPQNFGMAQPMGTFQQPPPPPYTSTYINQPANTVIIR